MNLVVDEQSSFLSHGLLLYKVRLKSVQLHENIVEITEHYKPFILYYLSFILTLNVTSFFRIFKN